MPAAKTKSAPTNGAAAKGKGTKTPSSGSGTPVVPAKTLDTAELTPALVGGSGKPEKAAYDAEQEKIKTEIDSLQVKLVCIP